MKKILSILFLSVLFIIPLFLLHDFFASPESCGFVSGEILLFLSLLLISQKNIFYRIPYFLGIAVYVFFSDSIECYITGLFYTSIVTLSIFANSKKRTLVLCSLTYIFLAIFLAENFCFSTFSMDLKNVWSSASFYWWGILLFLGTPLIFVFLNVLGFLRFTYLNKTNNPSYILLVLFVCIILGINSLSNVLQQRQPILEFSTQKFFWKICTPGVISHSSLLNKDTREHFDIWDSLESVYDFKKATVFVLMESWGVNQNVLFSDAIIKDGIGNDKSLFVGISQRKQAFTQGAEWEDFGKDFGLENFVPRKFKENGFETWFVHGYDGDFYNREKTYGAMGFDSLRFKKQLKEQGLSECKYGFSGICDSSVVQWLDNLLSNGGKKFVYWTTLDQHPPYEGQKLTETPAFCEEISLSTTECIYYVRQNNTIKKIDQLSRKHPEYRFILKGDHRPMGSMEESGFVASFYYKWVPLVILN